MLVMRTNCVLLLAFLPNVNSGGILLSTAVPVCLDDSDASFLATRPSHSLPLSRQAVDTARAGDSVAMKIEAVSTEEQHRAFGRHFDHTDALVSRISRESIDALKAHFQVRRVRVFRVRRVRRGVAWAGREMGRGAAFTHG
jgi:hypothetical protein